MSGEPLQLPHFRAWLSGSSVASLGSGVVGSYYGAKAQKSHLNFQASIADINARIAELGAQQELLRGQQEVGRLTLGAGQLKGSSVRPWLPVGLI